MKKLLLSIIVILGMTCSCTNDDIEIRTYGDLTYNVSTQSVYDDFNISDDFKERFLSESYRIGVYTFLYDENGELTAADSVFTRTFGKIEQKFNNIPTGQYTAITVEMLVNGNENNTSESWVLVGKDKMSTLQIVNKNYTAYWYSAVGLSQKEITIQKGNGQTLEISPQGIGAIVQTGFMNFDQSDYKLVGLHTKDQPRGRFLSPNYVGDDRFFYDEYLAERTWSRRGFVYHKEGLSNNEGASIYILEEGSLKYCFGAYKVDSEGKIINSFYPRPDNNSYIQIMDGKRYYGVYSYVGGTRDCEAGIFNTYDEALSWYKTLKFYFNDCPEPYLVWGASSSEVTNYMESQGLSMQQDGINTNNNTYWTYFENNKGTVGYEYRFNTDKTNLQNLLMSYSSEKYSKTDIMSKLEEKFVYRGYDEDLGGDFYYSADFSTLLLLFEKEGDYYVLYLRNSSPSKAKSQIENKSVMKNVKRQMMSFR